MYNAQLHGPASMRLKTKYITFSPHSTAIIGIKTLLNKVKTLLQTSKNEQFKKTFTNYNIVLAQQKPTNLLLL